MRHNCKVGQEVWIKCFVVVCVCCVSITEVWGCSRKGDTYTAIQGVTWTAKIKPGKSVVLGGQIWPLNEG